MGRHSRAPKHTVSGDGQLRDSLKAGAVLIGAIAAIAAVTGLLMTGASSGSVARSVAPPSVAVEPTGTVPATTPETESVPVAEEEPEPIVLEEFDVENALRELQAIEAFGVREGGSVAEKQAAEYIFGRLVDFGLSPRIEEFPLPTGRTSRNVIARVAGVSDHVLIIGAHMDSKPPSAGANDNASGCGAVLELARILSAQPVTATVEFVFFGTEEIIAGPDDHHLGSRHHANQMTEADRASTAGMLCVDMIGFGPDFHSRTMLRGPQLLSDFVITRANALGAPMTFLKDRGSTGWSDHEPFELAGIPVSWIQWRPDPEYHTARDTSDRIELGKVQVTGEIVLDICRALDEAELKRLISRADSVTE